MILIGCEDSLIEQGEPEEILESIDDAVRLSQIIITDPDTDDVLTDIAINYDQDSLISTILFTGLQNITYEFNYASNDRLTDITRTENGATVAYSLSYDGDEVQLLDSTGSVERTKLFSVDSQNRIFRTQTFENDALQQTINYNYTSNFNVQRINELSAGNAIERYQELTYFFNNNPFRDMNDVLRFIVFEDFIPYTRYLPSTINSFESMGGTFTMSSSVQFVYSLSDDNFPGSRIVTRSQGGVDEVTVETFIYTDN
ncbi:hypothetical protein BST97_08955 [Nonlabens spongiae]|uniref:DUF4595 domain-containing protein n=2 Tax=Nonlabens spongiae TaxID=331648 RepID=A0A1W6MKM2_9FLAO|nr:hypothetical protein BST97_08955 [Nonlabens spongiae]